MGMPEGADPRAGGMRQQRRDAQAAAVRMIQPHQFLAGFRMQGAMDGDEIAADGTGRWQGGQDVDGIIASMASQRDRRVTRILSPRPLRSARRALRRKMRCRNKDRRCQ